MSSNSDESHYISNVPIDEIEEGQNFERSNLIKNFNKAKGILLARHQREMKELEKRYVKKHEELEKANDKELYEWDTFNMHLKRPFKRKNSNKCCRFFDSLDQSGIQCNGVQENSIEFRKQCSVSNQSFSDDNNSLILECEDVNDMIKNCKASKGEYANVYNYTELFYQI